MPMTDANRGKLRLMLVTDGTHRPDLPVRIEAALKGGVRAVQMRERELPPAEFLALALALRELTRRHDALLLVNGDADAAMIAGADGVHLGWQSPPIAAVRAALGPARLIGVSTHSPAEAAAAVEAGADYVALGPIFDTPSKRGLIEPLGLDAVARAAAGLARSGAPLIAIGGIAPEHAAGLRKAGARGVAVIRGVMNAPDPEAAVRHYLANWTVDGAAPGITQ